MGDFYYRIPFCVKKPRMPLFNTISCKCSLSGIKSLTGRIQNFVLQSNWQTQPRKTCRPH